MKQYLIIPHLHINNVNAASSPYTVGFPAMTAWLGMIHALERRIQKRDGLHEVQLPRMTVACHACDLQVFKDKEKQQLIRAVAQRRGILVMTDVDSAGFVIRNFLRGIVPQEQILHAYIPTVKGKEKRKQEASKEGILGVEGIDRDALIESIRNSGAHIINSLPLVKGGGSAHADSEGLQNCTSDSENRYITKSDFFDYGLSGCANAAVHRQEVLTSLGLPTYLSTNAMISALNSLFTKDEFEQYLSQL